jgi:hypothetical protein
VPVAALACVARQAARARLRQQRRLEVDKTRKRDVQTGGAAGVYEQHTLYAGRLSASTTSKRSAMLAHPSTELVARAPCQLRRAHARSVRAARARLRQQRRLQVDESRKRDPT